MSDCKNDEKDTAKNEKCDNLGTVPIIQGSAEVDGHDEAAEPANIQGDSEEIELLEAVSDRNLWLWVDSRE